MSKTSPRIERGAALLDQTAPGWDRQINLNTLDLAHNRYCIVGQLYGNYADGLRVLDGMAEKRPASFGFLTWGSESYEALTQSWKAFLRSRRQGRRAA